MTARVAVIIPAAGRGRRFDESGLAAKVMAPLHGVPLVRTVAMTALASRASSVTIVTGTAHAEIADALGGLEVRIVQNDDPGRGLASSLQTGLAQAGLDSEGILVMLADMPLVRTATLDCLISRFARAPETIHAVVPMHERCRGNPVLIGRRLFARVQTLSGDEGARILLSAPDLVIEQCQVDDPGVTIDVDTAAQLAALEAKL